jgi:acyl-CoA dehydrogenase
MWALLCLFAFVSLISLLFYMRLNFKAALLIVASAWLAIQYYAVFSSIPLMIGWCLLGIFALFTYVGTLRIWCFSRPISRWYVKRLPRISPVEQMVLEAGGTWWEKLIFSGSPDLQSVIDKKVDALSKEEQSFLDNKVSTLCSLLNEWEINNKYKDLPKSAWDYIKAERFWAITLDKKYGGLGFSQAAHSAIVARVASRSISAAYTVMVPNSLGPAELIDYCGSQEQKDYYLPRLSSGQEIGCFGLTSLHAGSDAASIPDRGVVCRGIHNGQEILGIQLNFQKRYITLAPVATLIGLAFRLFDPDNLIGAQDDVGITVAIVPADHQGVEVGRRHSPLTLGFMNGPINGKNVFIPLDWVIGGRDNCGHGWKILMGCLSVGRGISMPALSSAVAQQCVRITGPYAKIRRQFKRSIGEFEGIQSALGRIGGFAYLIEANRYCLAQAVQDGSRPSVAAAISKYHLTELARMMLQTSMDIHSGHALQAGPGNLFAEVYNGLPISTVGEGANLMTRNLIIFGQGVMRAHPYIRHEILSATAAQTDADSIKEFDKHFFTHVKWSLRNWVKGMSFSMTGGRGAKVDGTILRREQQVLQRLSNAFTVVSDIALLKVGKALKSSEFISARLGDILSYLTLATCIIKYAHDHIERADDNELDYARWGLEYCFYNIGEAFAGFFANFKFRGWSRLIKFCFFPFGTGFRFPMDTVSQSIAENLQSNSAMRQRLSSNCFVGEGVNDPIGRVERAWFAILSTETLFAKVHDAISNGGLQRQLTRVETFDLALTQKIITAAEHAQLAVAEKLRDEALVVDEFAFHELVRFNAHVMDSANIDQ